MSAKWRLTVHPILGYQGEKGGGGANVLPLFFWRGQISTIMHLLRGQLSSPVNCLGGRCPHMPFFIGGRCPGGKMSGSRLFHKCIDRFGNCRGLVPSNTPYELLPLAYFHPLVTRDMFMFFF